MNQVVIILTTKGARVILVLFFFSRVNLGSLCSEISNSRLFSAYTPFRRAHELMIVGWLIS